MSRQVDVLAVESILYGVYKATYNVIGDSSASLLRKMAPEILNMFEKLDFDFSSTDNLGDIEMKLSETFKKLGMCDKITLSQKEDLLTVEINNCAFSQLTKRLIDEDIPLFACPFAALTIAIAERNLKKKARLKTIDHPSEDKASVVVQLS
ncbi:MAG: hypothetical protein ACFFDN_06635 [Candidatus Hodarchaeota archaeon]